MAPDELSPEDEAALDELREALEEADPAPVEEMRQAALDAFQRHQTDSP